MASTAKRNGSQPRGTDGRFMAAESLARSRQRFSGEAGLMYDRDDSASTGHKRDMRFVLGYPDKLTIKQYRAKYERGDIAERIVEAHPDATWSAGASLVENPAPDQETDFETAATDLFDRLDIWSRLGRADILAGLGRYSVLLIGAPGEPREPLETFTAEQLLYLRPLGEDSASIEATKTVKNKQDPRFGWPEFYRLSLGNQSGFEVHWSRIIHIADGALDNDLYGKPRLRAVWNRLLDLEKLIGGGSEAAWNRMDPGLHVDVAPEVEFDTAAQDALEDELEDRKHGLKRDIMSRGAKIMPLSMPVSTFAANVDSVLRFVAGVTKIPKRKLTGSERGELASTQDEANWQASIDERRLKFADPVARQLVDRLIEFGALPTPRDPYSVVWPSADEMDPSEAAEVTLNLAKANAAQPDGPILSRDEIRDTVYGLEPAEDSGVDTQPAIETEGFARLRAAKRRLSRGAADPKPELARVHRIADRYVPKVATVFLGLWVATGAAVPAAEFEAAIEDGDEAAAVELVIATVQAADEEFSAEINELILATLTDTGTSAATAANKRGSFLGASVRGAAEFNASFDTANPQAIGWAETQSSRLITEVSLATQEGIRAIIAAGIEEGIPPRKLLNRIKELVGLRSDQVATLDKFIADGATDKQAARYAKQLRRQRALLIARTETMRAANEGQRQFWSQSVARGELPSDTEREWIVTDDDRLRDSHAAREGERVNINEPFPGFEPGEEPNCLLPGAQVSGQFVAGLKAFYSGPAFEIRTGNGHRLSLTANHPVLTARGWQPAKAIKKGDQLVGYRRELEVRPRRLPALRGEGSVRRPLSSPGPSVRRIDGPPADNDKSPLPVEQVFDALALHRSPSRHASSVLDLHGDAERTDGKIQIVGSKSVLVSEAREAALAHGGCQGEFLRAGAQEPLVPGLRLGGLGLQRNDSSAASLPRRGELSAHGGRIFPNGLPLEKLSIGPAADFDTLKPEPSGQDTSADTAFVGDVLHRHAREVALDQVAEVRNFDFLGHVYDLQSTTGWMLAGGIAISNCRCSQGLV